MAKDKGKKAQPAKPPVVPDRTSANKLLIDFIKANKIVLIVYEYNIMNTDVKDADYVTIKRKNLILICKFWL